MEQSLTPLSELHGNVTLPVSQFVELLESHKLRLEGEKEETDKAISIERSVEIILKVVFNNITDKSLLGGMPNPLLLLVNKELEELNYQLLYKPEGQPQTLTFGSQQEDAIQINLNKYLS